MATPKRHTCTLRLEIDGQPYILRPLTPDRDSGVSRLYRLRKSSGVAYHVSQHIHGNECECPDFVYRRDGQDYQGCKHVRSLVALNLLDPDPEERPAASTWEEWTDSMRWTIVPA